MHQDAFMLALSLFGAILTFVGVAALLPLGMYRRLFGRVWPISPSESEDTALGRRLTGAIIVAIGLIILRACLGELFSHLR